MELLQINQCQAWCASQHFILNYELIWIVVAAFCVLGLYLLFEKAWKNNWFELQTAISQEFADKLSGLVLTFVFLLLTGFLVYYIFILKPAYATEFIGECKVNFTAVVEQTKVWSTFT